MKGKVISSTTVSDSTNWHILSDVETLADLATLTGQQKLVNKSIESLPYPTCDEQIAAIYRALMEALFLRSSI